MEECKADTVEAALEWVSPDTFREWYEEQIRIASVESWRQTVAEAAAASFNSGLGGATYPSEYHIVRFGADSSLDWEKVSVAAEDDDDWEHVAKRPRLSSIPDLNDMAPSENDEEDEDEHEDDEMLSVTDGIRITRRLTVNEIKRVTTLPELCWTVPRRGEDYAWLVDLRTPADLQRAKLKYKPRKANGEEKPMTMGALIKAHDQDAWGRGSSGSPGGSTHVYASAFGDDVGQGDEMIHCVRADHICGGVYRCELVDDAKLYNLERYAPEDVDDAHFGGADAQSETSCTFFASPRDGGRGQRECRKSSPI